MENTDILTLEEHTNIGMRLDNLRREADTISQILDDAYGPNTRIGQEGMRVGTRIRKLIDYLEARAKDDYGSLAEGKYWPKNPEADAKDDALLEKCVASLQNWTPKVINV